MNRRRQGCTRIDTESLNSFLGGLTPLLLAAALVVLLIYLAKLAQTIT